MLMPMPMPGGGGGGGGEGGVWGGVQYQYSYCTFVHWRAKNEQGFQRRSLSKVWTDRSLSHPE